MFFLFHSIYKLFVALAPFAEVVFLSYVLGYSFGSFPLSIVIFLFLLIATFLHSGMVKALAWGLVAYVLFYIKLDGSFLSGMLFAVLFGVIRYYVSKLIRRYV